jgi:hypothetical protein
MLRTPDLIKEVLVVAGITEHRGQSRFQHQKKTFATPKVKQSLKTAQKNKPTLCSETGPESQSSPKGYPQLSGQSGIRTPKFLPEGGDKTTRSKGQLHRQFGCSIW